VLGLLAGLWIGAWRAAGRPLPRARAAAFATGLAALALALNGPLHDLAERSLIAAHMAQHLVLTLLAPPCLLAGTPGWMLDTLLARVRPRRPAGIALRLLTAPVPALGLHGAILVVWHLPSLYALTLASSVWHLVAHTTMLASAVLAWWPVLSPSRRLPALPHAARILYLFAFGFPMTLVGALITGASDVLYPTASPTPLEDQRLGGILMWVPSGLVPLVAFTLVFYRWATTELATDPAEEAADQVRGA
ncbi:MAG TPA: cytochrome c oxidase assembly protein, partial [Candidatus Binatia bacterium]|nr:cytochrome c oxidase assembly protein [Candidatus Binatia bacterium]